MAALWIKLLTTTRREEEGQALVEYSLLLSLIVVATFIAVRAFGLGVSSLYQSIVDVYPK